MTQLTEAVITDISHQLRRILDDEEGSPNDKFVALELLKNANVLFEQSHLRWARGTASIEFS